MAKGRAVPPKSFLSGSESADHADKYGLVIKWAQPQDHDGVSIFVFDVDLDQRPDVQRLIDASAKGARLYQRCRWDFATAATGPDTGKTFITLRYEVGAPVPCEFDLVFVEGDHDDALNALRACDGRFALGYNGKGITLQAPIEELTPALQAYKSKMGLTGPVPTA